jgi:hypothetical protein
LRNGFREFTRGGLETTTLQCANRDTAAPRTFNRRPESAIDAQVLPGRRFAAPTAQLLQFAVVSKLRWRKLQWTRDTALEKSGINMCGLIGSLP